MAAKQAYNVPKGMAINITIPPNILTPTKFYNILVKDKDVILNELFLDAYASKENIEKEFNMALDFIKYVESLKLKSDLKILDDLHFTSYNLFQVLVDAYISCFATKGARFTTLIILIGLLKAFFFCSTQTAESMKTSLDVTNYATLIVTENADLHSVVDEITKSYKDVRAPWVIRNILVEENIKDKFLALLEKSLPKVEERYVFNQAYEWNVKNLTSKGIKLIQASNNDEVKATVAIGVPMSHVKETLKPSIPIIVLDSFRTTKEGVALANKEGRGEFVSVWSENITEAFEYVKCLKASTIWINCHGYLHPKCPFVLNGVKYSMKDGKSCSSNLILL